MGEGEEQDEANAWLEKVQMRPMLETLLEAICKDKPDKLPEYAVDWMRKSYPTESAKAKCLEGGKEVGAWATRSDVQPNPEDLMVYLKDIKATVMLEGIIEKAINERPENMVAFVVDSLASELGGPSSAPKGAAAASSAPAADAATTAEAAPPAATPAVAAASEEETLISGQGMPPGMRLSLFLIISIIHRSAPARGRRRRAARACCSACFDSGPAMGDCSDDEAEMKLQAQKHIGFGTLTDKNIEQLRKLNLAVFPVRYNDKFYSDLVASDRPGGQKFTHLGFFSDIMVGAVCCRVEPLEGSAYKVYIMTIGVLAPYRNLGIGKQLLDQVLAACAKEADCKEIYLHVHVKSDDAMKFYQKFDFTVDKENVVKDYYTKLDPNDAFIVSKKPPFVTAP